MATQVTGKAAFYSEPEKVNLNDYVKDGLLLTSGKDYGILVPASPEGNIKRLVTTCSSRYQLVRNSDVFPEFEELAKDHLDIGKVFYRSYGGSRFQATYLLSRVYEMEVAPGDTILPQVSIRNSYDGKWRLELTAGFHRLVCTNGLTIPVPGAASIKKKISHTLGSASSKAIQAAVESAAEFVNSAKDYTNSYGVLTKRKVASDKLPELLEDLTRGTKFPKKHLETAEERIRAEAKELNSKFNMWLAYNGLNYVINHKTPTLEALKRDKLDQVIAHRALSLASN